MDQLLQRPREEEVGRVEALSIFPEEIWKYILEMAITDVKDIETYYKTCRLWKHILEKKNPQWKFGLVFPSLYQYLSKNDILNCRLVSKRWRNGIDSYYPSNSSTVQNSKIKLDLDQISVERKKRIFRDKAFFRNESYRNAPASSLGKFILHSVHLTVVPDESPLSFFYTCGPDIRNLHITYRPMSVKRVLNSLRNILSLARKVENLKVEVLGNRESSKEEVKQNPFNRDLDHLATLDVSETPTVIRDILLKSFAGPLSHNAQNGVIQLVSKEIVWKGKVGKLSTIKNYGLTKVAISTVDTNPVHLLFKGMEIFKDLQVLSIRIGDGITTFPDNLNLPKLKSLRLLGNFHLALNSSFEFMGGLRQLEELKLQFTERSYKEIEINGKRKCARIVIINVHQYFEKIEDFEDDETAIRAIYKSNIWMMMPTLKSVCLSVFRFNQDGNGEENKRERLYTRREYNSQHLQF